MSGRHALFNFHVTKVMGAYRYRAARFVVARTAFGNKAREALRDPVKAYKRFHAWWRKRCVELSKVEYCPGLDTWRNVGYTMNCPPFGVYTRDKGRKCGRANICPFCFARRRIIEPFRRFETVLYGVSGPYMEGQTLWEKEQGKKVTRGAKLLQPRKDLKIVWYRRTIVIDLPKKLTLESLKEMVSFVKKTYVDNLRRSEFVGFAAQHGYACCDMTPLIRTNQMSLVRSGVLLVPITLCISRIEDYASAQSGAGRKQDTVKCGELKANKKNLFRAFVWAIRYSRWLTHVAAEWAVAFMKATKGFHAMAIYGKLTQPVKLRKPRGNE